MNLALESIYRVIDEGTQRMPKIVRETCAFCGGSGMVEKHVGTLATIERCSACAGSGRITVERHNGSAA